MEEIHRYIQKAFPKIHTTDFITRHVINQKSLVYHIKGSRFGHCLIILSIGKILHDPHAKMKAWNNSFLSKIVSENPLHVSSFWYKIWP